MTTNRIATEYPTASPNHSHRTSIYISGDNSGNRNELMLTLGGGYTNSSSNTYRNQYDLLLVDTPVFEDFLNLKEILIG